MKSVCEAIEMMPGMVCVKDIHGDDRIRVYSVVFVQMFKKLQISLILKFHNKIVSISHR